MILEGI